MVNKTLYQILDNIKSVDSINYVNISPNALVVTVNEADVNQLVCIGHLYHVTVICHSSNSSLITVSFRL